MDPREVPVTDEANAGLEDMVALIRFARSLDLESALTGFVRCPFCHYILPPGSKIGEGAP